MAEAEASDDALWLPAEAATFVTGWASKAERFCKGTLCVPLPPGRERELRS